jgi:hypothetical protein
MSLNREKYQALATLLWQFRTEVSTTQLDAFTLRQRLFSLQQLFGQQILTLEAVDSREQSVRTEISKQLRLLEIDVMFFQGSRKAATTQARLQTIGDRLTTLIQYCQAILQQVEKVEE